MDQNKGEEDRGIKQRNQTKSKGQITYFEVKFIAWTSSKFQSYGKAFYVDFHSILHAQCCCTFNNGLWILYYVGWLKFEGDLIVRVFDWIFLWSVELRGYLLFLGVDLCSRERLGWIVVIFLDVTLTCIWNCSFRIVILMQCSCNFWNQKSFSR